MGRYPKKPPNPVGRPSEYGPDILEKVKDFFGSIKPWEEVINLETGIKSLSPNVPPSIRDLAKHLDINRDTIYAWAETHKDFSDILEKCQKETREELVSKNGLMGNYNAGFAKFYAQNKLGWVERTETKADVTHNLPSEITINLVRPK